MCLEKKCPKDVTRCLDATHGPYGLFEVDTKYHLLDFKNKRPPLKLVNPYHIVAHMSSIKSEKIRIHKTAIKLKLPQGMLLMISRYEI
jgi:hypothetical protein